MATNLSPRRSPSRYSLILVSPLTLVGILGGCGASSTAGPSHPSVSTSTSTPTQKLKGTIGEFSLPDPDFRPGDLTAGPDGKLWFTEMLSNKIGRLV
jgi:streptogramin lyase